MDQDSVIIRKIEIKDAKEFNALKKQIEAESPFMLYDDGENQWTDEQQEKFIERIYSENSNNNLIVAQFNNKLVGFIAILGNPRNKKAHTKEIAMGVLKNFAGKGIGTKLINKAIESAKESKTKRVELSVISENTGAIALYQKMGFVKEGTKKQAINLDGSFVDEDFYGLIL